MIQSQAALACASCARSLGSSKRCPGVFGPEYLFCSFPPSALCQLSELYHAPCSLHWQLPRFGLKISSYSSITTSSGGLLLIFMEFLLHALWPPFRRMFRGGVLEDISFLLRHLFLFYPLIKGSFLYPQTAQMSCSQDICSLIVLSLKDTSVSGNTVVCAFFL